VRVSRFQFVDLAGSERLKDAHNGQTNWAVAMSQGDTGVVEGMVTNHGLMVLSQRVRELVQMHKRGKSVRELVRRSYNTQLEPDLIALLADSLTGAALTLVCVNVSSAPANTSQSVNALEFGQTFSGLGVRPRQVKFVTRSVLAAKVQELLASARGGSGAGNPKYQILREAQGRQGRQLHRILERLTGSQQASRAGGEVACVNEHANE